ncbi:MAG: hypothetical protein CVT49_10300 [candidate division Zixibacteria bacterium HGW-Zixibacteria-1]|nr:MAG: hypothetical protein CVT49_10300 [candidate division Zixibacteria bacterium HGW-Zixibacteria-1]
MPRIKPLYLIILAALIAVYVIHALSLTFTQDDAFISYRYVKNFLGGNGLVFNPGEKVEGYTNFLFVILMALFGRFGVNYIIVSKIIGILSGAGIMILSYIWFRKIFPEDKSELPALGAPALLAVNSAFAYWSISGLETVFFAALVFWGLYFASEKKHISIAILALAALTRPEGGMVFALVMIYFLASGTFSFRTIAKMAAAFALLIIPHFIFRLSFYGDWLPNPFYAKTGWSAGYFLSGLNYVWLFLKQYGLAGVLIIVPLIAFGKLPAKLRLLLFIMIAYIFYIILIGGDVLHGHRFFVPLMPIIYFLFFAGLSGLLDHIKKNRYLAIVAASIFITAFLTFGIPYQWIRSIRKTEIGLVDNMTYWTKVIHDSLGNDNYSIALSTIGAFSYYSDAVVIDLLGLTDRTIAKNPQPMEGIESTWKEKNYNIPYLMQRNPDLILFSTGAKPSSPAEKALFLSSRFRKGYYPVYHMNKYLFTIFRKKPGYSGPDQYYPDPRFINLYSTALYNNWVEKFDIAYEYAVQSSQCSPPDFYLPVALMGEIKIKMGEVQNGLGLLEQAFRMSDGYAIIAGDKLGRTYLQMGDSTRAQEYFDTITKNNRLD